MAERLLRIETLDAMRKLSSRFESLGRRLPWRSKKEVMDTVQGLAKAHMAWELNQAPNKEIARQGLAAYLPGQTLEPFLSFHLDPEKEGEHAARVLKQSGIDLAKLRETHGLILRPHTADVVPGRKAGAPWTVLAPGVAPLFFGFSFFNYRAIKTQPFLLQVLPSELEKLDALVSIFGKKRFTRGLVRTALPLAYGKFLNNLLSQPQEVKIRPGQDAHVIELYLPLEHLFRVSILEELHAFLSSHPLKKPSDQQRIFEAIKKNAPEILSRARKKTLALPGVNTNEVESQFNEALDAAIADKEQFVVLAIEQRALRDKRFRKAFSEARLKAFVPTPAA